MTAKVMWKSELFGGDLRQQFDSVYFLFFLCHVCLGFLYFIRCLHLHYSKLTSASNTHCTFSATAQPVEKVSPRLAVRVNLTSLA